MKAITAKEFADDFAHHSMEAQRGLVLIERAEGDPLVVLSMEEYNRLLERDRRVFNIHNLPEEDMQAIRDAEPSEDSARFDDEWDEPGTGLIGRGRRKAMS